MNINIVLMVMLFMHILDDFYLQGILANLKQKKWWNENAPKDTDSRNSVDKPEVKPLYKYDYIMGLFIHALSWAIVVHLPIFFVSGWNPHWAVYLMLGINLVIHAIVDDLKANKMKINLIEDQIAHIMQIIVTWSIWALVA